MYEEEEGERRGRVSGSERAMVQCYKVQYTRLELISPGLWGAKARVNWTIPRIIPRSTCTGTGNCLDEWRGDCCRSVGRLEFLLCERRAERVVAESPTAEAYQ